ncbi:MAG: hypothetical protein PHV18_02835 [Lachnospiraceae bacterium]|nr:hypothetical protein [Lachnospiraceae bacterium]
MGRVIKRLGILFGIFAAALLVYFISSRSSGQQDQSAYVDMGGATLPVVRVEMYGRTMNRMPGYRQEMDNSAAADSLTILPEDRALPVRIENSENPVTAIRYEIRSLDRERLVERTEIASWDTAEDGISVVLPIQNLLTREREYLLRLEVATEQGEPTYYYTRILWTENGNVQSMIDLAVSFSEKTFHYDQARDLVTYLETSATEDNSSFGHTSIRSSFAQLTWGRLKMQPPAGMQVTLKELDGIMSCVQLSYVTSRQDETSGQTEFYEVEETFTMKWNELRTYLMDYERTVNQIFQSAREDYSGKRIMLGITNDDRVTARSSANGAVTAYRVNRDLWSFEPGDHNNQAVKVFSFRDADMTDVRNHYDQHDVQILSVEDSGDIEFLVYGYMNRGNHEGAMGILGYHYAAKDNALEELFFIPYTGSYETLEDDLEQLVYRTDADMLYLYLDHAIYGIDLKSRENMVVADALAEGGYAISADKSRIAWQDGSSLYEAKTLHLMDLKTGVNQEVSGETGEYVRTLGFVGQDLVYGTARETDSWVINGRVEDLPMYKVQIINEQMNVETSYEKPGYYISGVQVEESRIHLNRITRLSDQNYAAAQEDTIVCNVDMGPGRLDGIGWYASQDKGKLYFVQMDEEIRSGRSLRLFVPRRVSFEQADLLELQSNYQLQGMRFYAYGGGHLQKVTMDFTEAVQLAYDKMGFVTDENRNVLWNRINRGTVRTIREPLGAFAPLQRHLDGFTASRRYSDSVMVLDARGCNMQQMLYFIDQGIPVLGYTGPNQYLVLCGFDQYNVTVYNPATGETYKAGLNDSTEFFRQRGNDFICAVLPQ